MKRGLLIGAVAALMMTGQANAEGGYVGAIYSETDVNNLGSGSGYALEGAAAFGDSVTFEVDGAYADSGSGDGTMGLTGHLYMRNEQHLFGGFVGFSDDDDTTTWNAGLEANKYFSDWTLAATAGYAENDDLNVRGYGMSAEARFFPTENVRLQGGLGWATTDVAYFTGVDIMTYGAGAEVRLGESPVSALFSWTHVDADDIGLSTDTLSLGVRLNWGGSLRDRDRNGASQGNGGIAAAFSF